MARAAQRDDRQSTGALYGDLADRIEALEAEIKEWRMIVENLESQIKADRVTGATDIVDEAACLIWSELCPDTVMSDEDRPYYEAAAKAVLALSPQGASTREEAWSASTHDEIIKRLMTGVGMPNSNSLYGAFKQFANELHALAHTQSQGASTREAVIEECAKICEELRHVDYPSESSEWSSGTFDCAQAVRALRTGK
jgi:hypothetical protein